MDPIVNHLGRLCSDHNPIFMCHKLASSPRNIPFRFEEMWIQHPTFLDQVNLIWRATIHGNPQFVLHQLLKLLRQHLKSWNKNTFGDLTHNIKAAKLHLQNLQLTGADDLETKSNLHNLLHAQEIHWHQMSRIKWLYEGDRNMKFFHLSAKARTSINSIDKIDFEGITWMTYQNQGKCSLFLLSSIPTLCQPTLSLLLFLQ